MDIKQYITSGILEIYVLERLEPAQMREVEAFALQYPEIRAEIDNIEQVLEDFAIAGEGCLRLDFKGMIPLKDRSPEIYEAINECAAFINYRSAEAGGESVIALCYGND